MLKNGHGPLKKDRNMNGGSTGTGLCQNTRNTKIIKENVVSAQTACFFAFAGRSVEYINNSIDRAEIWGTTEEFAEIRNLEITEGRFLTPYEFYSGKNMVVIAALSLRSYFREQARSEKKLSWVVLK